MYGNTLKTSLVGAIFILAASQSAFAQKYREPEGRALPSYAKVMGTEGERGTDGRLEPPTNGLPNIMLTGYWPPTNEMLRQFSNNLVQNPGGWVGEDWEGRGYNVLSFFPEFPPEFPNKGEGDFEVDYQDTSDDFWRLVAEIEPVAIITFGATSEADVWRVEGGDRMWAIEPNNLWLPDYLEPLQPTIDMPIGGETPLTDRWSTLPLQAIVDAVAAEVPALVPFYTDVDASRFLCNFIGYHAVWYHDLHPDPADPVWVVASGHIHVGDTISLPNAELATEVTVRTLIDYIDPIIYLPGDFDGDREINLPDHAAFAACFTGDGGGMLPDCDAGDFDDDGDVDCTDWYAFVLAWTDPGDPPPLAQCPAQRPATAPYPHDARKNRYISFDTNNAESGPVAFRIDVKECRDFPEAAGISMWLGQPDGNDVSRVVDAAYFTDTWPAVLHVGDCEIAPCCTYEMRATSDGTAFTNPFEVGTILDAPPWFYGDTAGVGTGDLPPLPGFTPPNQILNVNDVTAYLLTAKGDDTPSAHVTWVDLHGLEPGCVPNYILNVADLQRILFGLEGQLYTDSTDQISPADCP